MDDLFTIIGKLYFDLVRSQSAIESMKQQIQQIQKQQDTQPLGSDEQ